VKVGEAHFSHHKCRAGLGLLPLRALAFELCSNSVNIFLLIILRFNDPENRN
jgi:hypothetical protein